MSNAAHKTYAALLLAAALSALLASGCSRLSFVKPSPKHRGYTQVAPTYNVGTTSRAQHEEYRQSQHLVLIEQALQAGQIDVAEREARTLLRNNGRSEQAHTAMAMVLQAKGDVQGAGEHVARALQLAPNQPEMLHNRAAWLCNNGRAAEALPLFRQALQNGNNAVPLAFQANAGACAVKAGDYAHAEANLREVLQADANNAVALQGMAELLLVQGKPFEARAFIQRRVDLPGLTPEILQKAIEIEHAAGAAADTHAINRYRALLQQNFPQSTNTQGQGQ